MKKLIVGSVILFTLLNGIGISTMAQHPVKGRVLDGITFEALGGVRVTVGSVTVSVTDETGYFRFNTSDSVLNILFSHIGYRTEQHSHRVNAVDSFQVKLFPASIEMDEITIVHNPAQRFLRDTRTGTIELTANESRYLPLFIGQPDLFKTLELMPGYRTGGEGDASIYIRGGYFDQNLILLDGAPVYNPSHLLGFYSVFNPDVVNRVELIKSGIPAEYGNRLSSVIVCSSDVEIPTSLTGGGGVGMLSTNAFLNVPLIDDKMSVYMGFRKTHINMILGLMDEFDLISSRSVEFESGYDLYDINGGFLYQPNSNHRLSLNFYKGRDVFSMLTPAILLDADMEWGNEVLSFNWNHRISHQLSLHHTIYYSDYDFEIELRNPAYDLLLSSGVKAYGQKTKMTYTTDHFRFSSGVDNKYQIFKPNTSHAGTGNLEFDFGTVDRHYLGEYSLFFAVDGQLTSRWMFTTGARINRAVHYGPYRKFGYGNDGVLADTTFFERGDVVARFTHPDLMASISCLISNNTSLKFSYNRNHQYSHMVNATSVSFPVDFWVASGTDIPHQYGWQAAAGWYRISNDGMFRGSAEVYYKKSVNHSEFNNYFMQSIDNTPLIESLVYGSGRAWGIEYLMKKVEGRWTGWLGYTFSKSIGSVQEIEDGRWFPTTYDRPHDASLVVSYDHNEKWKFGGTFVYSTGRPYTPSIGRYFLGNNVVSIYGARNSARFPDYHRMDLSATRVFRDTGKRYSALVFSVYNAYNRSNPFFIFPKAEGDLEQFHLEVEPYEVSIFPVLPSIAWQFRF